MNRFIRLPLAGAACLLLFGCRGDTASPKIEGPMFAVSDGAHNGNPDFFFLPPLFKNPNTSPNYEPTAANMNLRPAVEICQLGDPTAGVRACVALIKRFDPSAVTASTADQHYHVNWKTDESRLDPAKFYRINVLVGVALLGFADVDPVSSGSQLKNVLTNEYIPLLPGRTLPIKFRIENRALCAPGVPACAGETINLNQGGQIELVGGGEHFKLDIPPQTRPATFNNQTVTDVTFNLELCSGIDVDLPTLPPCLRVATYFNATGSGELEFSNALLVSFCVLTAEHPHPDRQDSLITLHQQDGSLIRALPHASNCSTVSSSGWEWLKSLAARFLTPRPAYAATRSALLNVGGGGETGVLGAKCTPASSPTIPGLMLITVCPPSSPIVRSGPQRSAMATITPPQTVSDFQFALPAKMDYVDPDDASRSAPPETSLPTAVKVTDWDGTPVAGARVTFIEPGEEPTEIGTATSDIDGIAEISWTIGAGLNTVVATGRGIAAQNNYPDATVKPFMPDISPGAVQTPVALGTGMVTFTATGVASLTAPLLSAPAAAAIIQQNRPDIGCSLLTGEEGRGYGFQIPFDWADVPGAVSYEVVSTRTGAAIPNVNTTTETSRYTHTECNSLVQDANLGGWEWRVRAQNAAGAFGPWSETRLFSFAPCRLPDGSVCRTGAISGLLTDPSGDAGTGSDFVWTTGTVADGNVTLSARFAGTTYNSSTFVVWNLDTDQNTATGAQGITSGNADADKIGADYIIWVHGTAFGSLVLVRRGDFSIVSSTLVPTYASNGVDVTIPLSLLAEEGGGMNYKVTVQTQIAAGSWTGINDFISNLGLPVGTVVP